MFDLRAYYAQENAAVAASYARSLEAVAAIVAQTDQSESAGRRREIYRYFNRLGKTILACAALEDKLDDRYLYAHDFGKLQHEFNALSSEAMPAAQPLKRAS